MMKWHDTGHGPENQGAPPGEQFIQPESIELLNIVAAFLDYTPDALVVIDSAGTIVLVNTQMETLFGYERDALIGQPIELLIPEHLRMAHTTKRARYMQAPRSGPVGVGLDLMGQRKDGSQFPVEISLRPIQIKHTLHVIGAVRDMTAQRETERERMRIFQRLRQQDKLLSMSHDAIVVRDQESHIVSWNAGSEHLYGWTEEEVVGDIAHTLLQTRFPISHEAVKHTLERHGQWEGELTHICRDGRQVIVESRQALVHDEQGTPAAILEINRDVTERRRLERLEQEAHAEIDARLHVLQMILDHLPSGVFLVQGPQLRLLLANQAATAIWGAPWPQGQPQEEFLCQHRISIFTPTGQPHPLEDMSSRRAMASGEPVLNRQFVIRRSDGTSIPVIVDAIPLERLSLLPRLPQGLTLVPASTERVILIVYRNVRALKEAEALKDQFISLATHELRTPVTIIAGYADRLISRVAQEKGHELDEWQREKMQEIKHASWHLATLTEELLDIIRMQAGQFQLECRPTDLAALTRQEIERLQTTTNQHQLTFHTTVTQLWALVDAFRIEQILSNLLSNAIKYSPGGGLIEVTLEAHEDTHEARFRVRDQGMGIPYAQQASLFGRFVRGENVRVAGIRGTGLGLYLCRELIEQHGGHISFESEEGVGSTFFFSLHCTEVVHQEKGDVLHKRTGSASPFS